MEAGLEVYARDGYANAKVKQICLQAGLTERYFYQSFDDKEDLLIALVDSIFDDALEATSPALENLARPLDEVVREALGDFLESLIGDPRRARVMLLESVGVSTRTELRRRAQFSRFRDLLRDVGVSVLGERAPSFDDADMTARALVGVTVELLVSFLLGEINVDRERLTDYLVQIYTTAAPIQSGGLA
ncbi:MAG: TetR/AcrR family transcriptional regulator [Thermoleophilaceae bacterium]|nr:TetR/AcrR family transcriptional regulator [Thermoleophilaceae bacterium]